MYGIFAYMFHKSQIHVGKYTYIDLMGYEMMDNTWINSLQSLLAGFLNHQRYSYIRQFDLLSYIWV